MRPLYTERERHTRLGWWLMTHPKAADVVMVATALALLGLDLWFVSARWGEAGGHFARAFETGLGFSVASTFVGVATLRLRGRRRMIAKTFEWLILLGALILAERLHHYLGFFAGLVAMLALIFAASPIAARRRKVKRISGAISA